MEVDTQDLGPAAIGGTDEGQPHAAALGDVDTAEAASTTDQPMPEPPGVDAGGADDASRASGPESEPISEAEWQAFIRELSEMGQKLYGAAHCRWKVGISGARPLAPDRDAGHRLHRGSWKTTRDEAL